MGLGEIGLVLLLIALLALSLFQKQALAPWVLAAGGALFAYLMLSVLFNFRFPYRTHNISIYVLFFVAVLLVSAGGVGTVVRTLRRLRATPATSARIHDAGKTKSMKPPLRPDMTVRQIAADYPDCQEILRSYGERDRPGVKFGHLEPLENFTCRQGVETKRLLCELAAAAGVSVASDSSLDRGVHRPFIVMALATTLSIGAGWGGWLLWQIGRGGSFEAISAASIVAHGEAQLWGFIAPFVVGIALRYLPVVSSGPAVKRSVARSLLCFLFLGIAGAFVWALAPGRLFWLSPASGACLVLAAILYFTSVRLLITGKLRSTWARFVLTAAGWLLAWAGYTLWLRMEYSSFGPGAFAESARFRLLELAVFGFAMSSIYGFGLRLLPGFLGSGSPQKAAIEIAFWLHNLGAAALIGAGQRAPFRAVGAAAILCGAIFYAAGMRGFRGRARETTTDSAAASRPEIGEPFLRRYLQWAFAWLLISLAMLTVSGAAEAWRREAASHSFVGAARHALTVGFMTTLIMGVAQRLLPILGQTLLAWPGLVRPIFFLIAVGNLLRVGSELATARSPLAYRIMPVSALFELTALTLFAANCLRTMWPRRDPLLQTGRVTGRSSLKTLLAQQPAIEDALIGCGFGYVARVRAVPGELTIGSFAAGEGQDPAQTVERINAWLHAADTATGPRAR